MRTFMIILTIITGLTSWSKDPVTFENRLESPEITSTSDRSIDLFIQNPDTEGTAVLDRMRMDAGSKEISFSADDEVEEHEGGSITLTLSTENPDDEIADPDGEPRILTLLERVTEILAPYKK